MGGDKSVRVRVQVRGDEFLRVRNSELVGMRVGGGESVR